MKFQALVISFQPLLFNLKGINNYNNRDWIQIMAALFQAYSHPKSIFYRIVCILTDSDEITTR